MKPYAEYERYKIDHPHTLFSLLSFANLSSMSLICRILSSDAFCSGRGVQGHKPATHICGFTAITSKSIVGAHRLVKRHVGRKPTSKLLKHSPAKEIAQTVLMQLEIFEQPAYPVDAWMAEDCVNLGSVSKTKHLYCARGTNVFSNCRQHLGEVTRSICDQRCC